MFIPFMPCKMRQMHFGCWGHYLHFSASKIGLLWVTWKHVVFFRPKCRFCRCRKTSFSLSSFHFEHFFVIFSPGLRYELHFATRAPNLVSCFFAFLVIGCSIWSSRVPGDPIRLVSQLNQILHVRGELLTYECFEPFTAGCFFWWFPLPKIRQTFIFVLFTLRWSKNGTM